MIFLHRASVTLQIGNPCQVPGLIQLSAWGLKTLGNDDGAFRAMQYKALQCHMAAVHQLYVENHPVLVLLNI